ncbi:MULTISPECIES: hypothetical protein [Achromobacter]|jgi:hypothetical protein|uniref:Uncharacterized protein n=1 Tax=Achromobacter marplatensis TaxID=470868 RepID=A0ABX9GE14_9BURK|nr:MULTISPECIES: hypothetical protein [Achromobacter]RBP20913.1 hypothetical protein DFP87_103157 [Achromobacter marplatensis]CAB3676703.1 hypothetical protein LMG26219_04099 [Achromobacter marplatensis]CAB3873878.1 hypothetical protein LMG26684_03221 [Achromobacter mucicolens]
MTKGQYTLKTKEEAHELNELFKRYGAGLTDEELQRIEKSKYAKVRVPLNAPKD